MRVLTVTAKPHAKRDEVGALGNDNYEISTTREAKEGKANAQVLKLLAKHLNVSPSKLIMAKGERWNTKTFLLTE